MTKKTQTNNVSLLSKTTLNTKTTWEYSLEHDGFRVEVRVELPEGKTLSLSNIMPWEDFIHGLGYGWKHYHQNNPEFTTLINEFIETQIALENYVPCEKGAS
jgi:hypothetical protein